MTYVSSVFTIGGQGNKEKGLRQGALCCTYRGTFTEVTNLVEVVTIFINLEVSFDKSDPCLHNVSFDFIKSTKLLHFIK